MIPILDIKHIKKITKNFYNLKTILRKTKNKGTCIFANKNIKKNEVVAYYLLKAYKLNTFLNPFNSIYTVELYSKNGNPLKNLIGDISIESYQQPDSDGVAFWGYFANEPSPTQESNTYLDVNSEFNFLNRSRIKDGDLLLYKIIASKDIKKGEEITWCYGSLYYRNYKTSCIY